MDQTCSPEYTRHIPADDEPSIWGNSRQEIGTDWLLWHSQKYGVGIVQSHGVGLKVLEQLEQEPPRTFKEGEPSMVAANVEFKRAGIDRKILSLRWVIWAKHTRQLDWLETHQIGLIMIHSTSPHLPKGHEE